MRWLAEVMLWGWPLVTLALFATMPARRAAAYSFVLGWLFLPVAAVSLRGIPDLTKLTVSSYGVLAGMLLMDKTGALYKLRPSLFDLPMAVWCLVPMATSIYNGLGVYDGYVSMMMQLFTWGIPYIIGRAYFSDAEGMKELLTAMIVAAIIYVPFVLYEVRFSPQLHRIFYGRFQHDFGQTKRLGGWRPQVFMDHGLMLSIFMCVSALASYWLWRTRHVRKIASLPITWVFGGLMVTAVLCRSAGALGLLVVGFALLYVCGKLKSTWPILLLCLSIPVYLAARIGLGWDGEVMAENLIPIFGEDRVDSLMFRVRNEVLLIEHTREQIMLGWGGWGRAFDIPGIRPKQRAVPDSMWIIAFSQNGVVGLVSLMTAMLLPLWVLFRRLGPHINAPSWGPVVACGIIILLYTSDFMLNAMIHPFYMLSLGGLTGIALWRPPKPARRPAGRPVGLTTPATVSDQPQTRPA